MLNLADVVLFLVVNVISQAAPSVGDPAPPTVTAALTDASRKSGYDAFDPEGRLVFRVSFTPAQGSDHGRLPAERVWEARRVRFLPEADRAIEEATSLSCPGIAYVLERMAALDLGRFNIVGATEPPKTLGPQFRDGHTYRFHGPGLDPVDARSRPSVEGSGGHVGDLGRVADFQLKDCWRRQTGR